MKVKKCDPLTKERDKQLLRCIPDIYDHKTLLHIGAQMKGSWPIFRDGDVFEALGYKIDILEIWPPNVAALQRLNKNGHKFRNKEKGPGAFRTIIEGDVSNPDHLGMLRRYDVIMYWHGPEHIPEDKIQQTLTRLFMKTLKILAISTPCGNHQRTQEHNPYEEHLSTLYPALFEGLGFETDLVGECGQPGNNLMAWRRA